MNSVEGAPRWPQLAESPKRANPMLSMADDWRACDLNRSPPFSGESANDLVCLIALMGLSEMSNGFELQWYRRHLFAEQIFPLNWKCHSVSSIGKFLFTQRLAAFVRRVSWLFGALLRRRHRSMDRTIRRPTFPSEWNPSGRIHFDWKPLEYQCGRIESLHCSLPRWMPIMILNRK